MPCSVASVVGIHQKRGKIVVLKTIFSSSREYEYESRRADVSINKMAASLNSLVEVLWVLRLLIIGTLREATLSSDEKCPLHRGRFRLTPPPLFELTFLTNS